MIDVLQNFGVVYLENDTALTVSPLTILHFFIGSGSFLFTPFMYLTRLADCVHGLQDMLSREPRESLNDQKIGKDRHRRKMQCIDHLCTIFFMDSCYVPRSHTCDMMAAKINLIACILWMIDDNCLP